MRAPILTIVLAVCASLAACPSTPTADDGAVPAEGEGEGEGEGEVTADPFEADHIIDVVIEMDPDEWQELANEGRSFVDVLRPGCVDAPFESPFVEHPGAVTIDGEVFAAVNIKKKGFLGSLSVDKPSLKLDLDDIDTEAQWRGLDKVVLNNARQDPSALHTCLAYGVFAAAGVPAPRCSFAHVTVNGLDKGLYVQVENIKKRFLRRWFDDDSGNLYEGTLSDFSPAWQGTFERETNLTDAPVELTGIAIALEASDETLMSALDAVIDLDAFYSFWAAEVLVGHWDGYSGNQNNFFVYGDPTSGKAHFIAWGADATMEPSQATSLVSVQAQGLLTRRLYAHPEGRAAFQARLRTLLDGVWDETALTAEVDRMEGLVASVLTADERTIQQNALVTVRGYIDNRRVEIEAELEDGGPEWTDPFRDPFCRAQAGAVDVSFSTTFGSWPTQDTFATGDGVFAGVLLDESLVTGVDAQGEPAVGAAIGLDENVPDGSQTLLVMPALLTDGRVFVPIAVLRTRDLAPGVLAIDDVRVQLVLLEFVDGQPVNRGRAYDGSIAFDAAASVGGAAVTGTLHADLIQLGF